MNIKIALIIERANVVLGGAERSVFELSSALNTFGFDTEILAATGQTNAKNIRILCGNSAKKRTSHSTFAKALKKHLTENHYDIIHSFLPFDFADIYQPRGGSYAESILQNAASFSSPFMRAYKKYTAFANWRRTILLHAEKRLCKNPDGPTVAALSKYVADQFRTHYHLDNERITVIPNGVRINKKVDQTEADKLRTEILAKLNLKEADNPALFLFVANNFRLKGLSPLIKALSLASRRPAERPAFLIVAGSGKSYKYRLLARQHGIHKRILFLGSLRNIQNALSITDVAVLPTFYDPSSRYILEALSAEKPVITTKFNGAADMFTNEVHGKVVPTPADIEELTQAISYFSYTKNIANASEAIANDNLKDNISNMRVASQLAELYQKIIDKRSSK